MEPVSATLFTFGVVLLVFSWIYLISASFKEDFSWGLVSLFLPPLSYLYVCINWSKVQQKPAVWLALGGLGMVFLAF